MGPGGLELGAAESGHPAQCRRKGAEGDHPGQSDVQIQAQSLSCSVQGALKLYNWCVRINGLREEEEGGREQWRWGKGGRNLLLPSHLSSLGTETLPSPKTSHSARVSHSSTQGRTSFCDSPVGRDRMEEAWPCPIEQSSE